MEQLSQKLTAVTESKEAAIQATEDAKKQVKLLEEANSSNLTITNGFHTEDLESGKEEYTNVLSELNAAKKELTKIRQDYDSSLEAKAIATKQVEEAEMAANFNSERAFELSKEISSLKETIEQVRQASVEAQQEKAKVFSEKDIERQSYKARQEESKKKLQMMKKECDPDIVRNLEAQLSEAMSEIEAVREEVESAKASDVDSVRTVTSELDGAKESLHKLLEEESSLQSLVNSLKEELENLRKEHMELKEKEAETESFAGNLHVELQKYKYELEATLAEEAKANGAANEMIQTLNQLALEAENARRESEEMKLNAEELKKEADATRVSLEEAEEQLKIVLQEAEEAKMAEVRALDQIKALSEQTDAARSSTSESDAKITISRDELEALSRKAEESEKLAEMKVAAAMAQVEAVKAGEREAIKRIETAQKEVEEMKRATEEAMKKAEMAEKAKKAIEGELRRWREKEQKKTAEAATRILAETQVHTHHLVTRSGPIDLVTRSGPIDLKKTQGQDVLSEKANGHKKLDKQRTSVSKKVLLPSISGIFHKKNQGESGSPSYLPGEI